MKIAPTPKPVFDGDERIGDAANWREVTALLVALGWNTRVAGDAVRSRGVEAPAGFHLITPASVEVMLAKLRAVRQSAE